MRAGGHMGDAGWGAGSVAYYTTTRLPSRSWLMYRTRLATRIMVLCPLGEERPGGLARACGVRMHAGLCLLPTPLPPCPSVRPSQCAQACGGGCVGDGIRGAADRGGLG